MLMHRLELDVVRYAFQHVRHCRHMAVERIPCSWKGKEVWHGRHEVSSILSTLNDWRI